MARLVKRLRKPFKLGLGTLSLCLLLGSGVGYAAPAHEALRLKQLADSSLKQGQTARAISLYQKALKKDRELANAYYNSATAHYLRREYHQAAANLLAFVLLVPEDAEALYNLGCLKLRLGDFEEAEKFFRYALNCPSCDSLLAQKTKEALLFMKDLLRQNLNDQKLLSFLLQASEGAAF